MNLIVLLIKMSQYVIKSAATVSFFISFKNAENSVHSCL